MGVDYMWLKEVHPQNGEGKTTRHDASDAAASGVIGSVAAA
jgi:hypothetical protein